MKDHTDLESGIRNALGTISRTSFEPALLSSDFSDEILAKVKPDTQPPDDVSKNSLETAHKNIMFAITIDEDPELPETVSQFFNLLDFALICAELGYANQDLPLLMLEDIFETQTIPSCERIFQYLESRVERITAGMDGGKGKALVLLRLSNELLRRSSKAEDIEFNGRILTFLSKSFPISERSAVNLRGEFNTQNVTVYDEAIEEDESTDVVMEDESEEKETVTVEGSEKGKAENGEKEGAEKADRATPAQQKEEPIDSDKLYPIFWSLQHDFSDPARLFVPENFQKFKKGLAATMAKFKVADLQSMRTSGSGRTDSSSKKEDKLSQSVGDKRKHDWEDDSSNSEGFNPKYLTSKELFSLELNDLTFRRHVMVQAMILLDFLLSLTPAAKEKWKDLKTPNRSVQYAFTLETEDEKWASKTKNHIIESLQYDMPGKLFTRLINTCLSREQNWVLWKAEGCNPFDMAPMPKEELFEAEKKACDSCKRFRPFPHVMGTEALSKLWQESGDAVRLDGLSKKDRYQVPSLEDFNDEINKNEEELKDAMFPDDIEQSRDAKDANTWKALRLAAHDRLYLFNSCFDDYQKDRNDVSYLFEAEKRKSKEHSRPRGGLTPQPSTPKPATPTPVENPAIMNE